MESRNGISDTPLRRIGEHIEFDSDTEHAEILERLKSSLAEPRDAIPERIAQYEILDLVGQGGMGTVYRAVHPVLHRHVALKVVKPSRAFDPVAKERFLREIRTVGKLRHPNIVMALDAGFVEDRPYLVMELLEGFDLGRLVRRKGPLPLKEACDLIRQVAQGLHYAHEAGIIHRDIKPTNLFLCCDIAEEGVNRPSGYGPKILDLGLAVFHENVEDSRSTRSGQVVGSPDFLSPEQAKGLKPDRRADIYSLGLTLYYLLAGTSAFPDERYKTAAEKIAAPLRDAPSTFPLPEIIVPVFKRMTAKNPDERYSSAAEVAAILHAIASVPTAPPVTPPPLQIQEVSTDDRRKNRFGLFLGIAVLALSILIGMAVFSPRSKTQSPPGETAPATPIQEDEIVRNNEVAEEPLQEQTNDAPVNMTNSHEKTSDVSMDPEDIKLPITEDQPIPLQPVVHRLDTEPKFPAAAIQAKEQFLRNLEEARKPYREQFDKEAERFKKQGDTTRFLAVEKELEHWNSEKAGRPSDFVSENATLNTLVKRQRQKINTSVSDYRKTLAGIVKDLMQSNRIAEAILVQEMVDNSE